MLQKYSMLQLLVLVSLSAGAFCAVTSQDCDDTGARLSAVSPLIASLFYLQDGSSLTKCVVNGPQCCRQDVINLISHSLISAVHNSSASFTVSGFADAQEAVDKLRNETNAILIDITVNNIRPLLLSAVPSPTTDFINAVNVAMVEFTNALTGSRVDLKSTISKYFRAVATYYLDKALSSFSLFGFRITIRLSSYQKNCAIQAIFNQIYTYTDGAAEMVDLLQNTATAIAVIKQLPPQFDKLIANVKSFRFSETCLEVFITNLLCPFCVNQPWMCPGRCNEILVGCLSPLNQAIMQLDTSVRLILSIVKSLAGSPGKVTDHVNLNRIPILYNKMVASLKDFDFVNTDFIKQLLTTCGVSIPTPPPIRLPSWLGRRDLDDYAKEHKRALNIPNVQIDQSLFGTLERDFGSLGSDEISSAMQKFCSPEFSVPVSGFDFKITAENGMCSYGLGNVGTYNSTFTQRDVVDQAYDNPAGYYNYTELINQAKNQTYVITDLFSNTDIPKSVFSVFLPNEGFPTNDFLSAPPPVNPNPVITTSSTVYSSSSISLTSVMGPVQTSLIATQPASTIIHSIIPSPNISRLTELVSEVPVTRLTEPMSSPVVTQILANPSIVVATTPTNELQIQPGSSSAVTSSHFVFYTIVYSIAVLLSSL